MKNFKKLVSIGLVFLLVITILVPTSTANAAKATKATKTTQTKVTKTTKTTKTTKKTKKSKIKLSRKSATVNVGKTTTINISGTKKRVTWSSSNAEVATVTSKGKVKGKSVGSAIITATVNGTAYTCNVTVKAKKTPYKMNESWKVAGQWDFKFTSAVNTTERIAGETLTPAQVIVLTYDYENLGFTSDTNNLMFAAASIKVVDENGVVAQSYPIAVTAPQDAAIGVKCIGAQQAFSLQNLSGEVTVYVEAYDGTGKLQKAKFALDITN